ncbi:MAG: hypothetical protein SNJ79_06245 [Sphingomonadaceae bacterium]
MPRIAPFLVLVLAACAATPPPLPAPAPVSYQGLDAVMGRSADVALALVGPSNLDRREGEARQLQFAGACVLDIFYLPPPGGNLPVATHADARRPDGSAMPPGECLTLLQQARSKP